MDGKGRGVIGLIGWVDGWIEVCALARSVVRSINQSNPIDHHRQNDPVGGHSIDTLSYTPLHPPHPHAHLHPPSPPPPIHTPTNTHNARTHTLTSAEVPQPRARLVNPAGDDRGVAVKHLKEPRRLHRLLPLAGCCCSSSSSSSCCGAAAERGGGGGGGAAAGGRGGLWCWRWCGLCGCVIKGRSVYIQHTRQPPPLPPVSIRNTCTWTRSVSQSAHTQHVAAITITSSINTWTWDTRHVHGSSNAFSCAPGPCRGAAWAAPPPAP